MPRYRDELRADFARYYHSDLDALLGGGRARYAAALAAHLPRGSATVRAIDPSAEWSQADYLLAGIAHRIDLLMWSMADPKKRGPEPRPMRTPADAARIDSMRRRSDPGEIARKLNIPPERR